LIALSYRERTGRGQFVDASIQEAVVGILQLAPHLWFYRKAIELNPNHAEARRTLRRLHGKETPKAMLALLPKADPKTQIELIGALADTGSADAAPQLLAMVSTSEDAKVRSAAYGGLRLLGDTPELSVLVEGLVKGVRPGDEEAATQAVAHIATQGKDTDAAIGVLLSALRQAAAAGPRARLVGLLGRTGSAKALPAVRQAAVDEDETIQDAGVRALAQWPDGAVSGDLLGLASTSPKETHRALALRGYVRLVHVPRQRPAEEKLAMCREAFALSRTADEKKLVLGALGDGVSPAALNMAVGLLSDEPVREEAAAAVLRAAEGFGGDLKRPDVKESVRAALKKALDASKNDDVRKGVLALMKRIDG
jgi:HEAT repeat protein